MEFSWNGVVNASTMGRSVMLFLSMFRGLSMFSTMSLSKIEDRRSHIVVVLLFFVMTCSVC